MFFKYTQTSYTRGLTDMLNKPAVALRKRRTALLHQLPPLKAILRGSLIERYKRCGKPGCKCADGPGHGPKYYLSVSYPGLRPQMDYVPQEAYAEDVLAGAVAVLAVVQDGHAVAWFGEVGVAVG